MCEIMLIVYVTDYLHIVELQGPIAQMALLLHIHPCLDPRKSALPNSFVTMMLSFSTIFTFDMMATSNQIVLRTVVVLSFHLETLL